MLNAFHPRLAQTLEKLELDTDLWHMDKEDDEAGVVIEESGGGVGMVSTPVAGPSMVAPAATTDTEVADEEDAGGDVDDLFGFVTDKIEDYGDWDGYEQEV